MLNYNEPFTIEKEKNMNILMGIFVYLSIGLITAFIFSHICQKENDFDNFGDIQDEKKRFLAKIGLHAAWMFFWLILLGLIFVPNAISQLIDRIEDWKYSRRRQKKIT